MDWRSMSSRQGQARLRSKSSSNPPRLMASWRNVATSGGEAFSALRIMFRLCRFECSSVQITNTAVNRHFPGKLAFANCPLIFLSSLPSCLERKPLGINGVGHFRQGTQTTVLTRMWANAQPDGRPVEHRWRPLFNAAKLG